MPDPWECTGDHSMVSALREFIGNPLGAHDNQMRALSAESKVTSEVARPMAEPGLGTRPPASCWSRTIVTPKHRFSQIGLPMVWACQGEKRARTTALSGPCPLSTSASGPVSCPQHTCGKCWMLRGFLLTSVYRWENKDRKYQPCPQQACRAAGRQRTRSCSVFSRVPCKRKPLSHVAAAAWFLPSPEQAKGLWAIGGISVSVFHHRSKQSTVHDTK